MPFFFFFSFSFSWLFLDILRFVNKKASDQDWTHSLQTQKMFPKKLFKLLLAMRVAHDTIYSW